MQVGTKGLELIKRFEGYHTKLEDGSCVAYLDTLVKPSYRSSGYKGLWTIGYGSTGYDVTEGTHWSQAKAQKKLLIAINEKAREISKYLHVSVNQNQFDALCSAAYNLGTKAIRPILDLINEGDLEGAASKFLAFDHAGGKRVKGLTRRRRAEKNLFTWETPDEVVEMSKPLKTSLYTRIGAALSALLGTFSWSNLAEARQFINDHAGLMLLGGVLVIFFLSKLFDKQLLEEFDNDRYVPVGTKETEDEDNV